MLLFPPTAPADYQAGLKAYNHGRYGEAMQDWLEVVESPVGRVNPAVFAESHYAIAMLHWQGQGVPRDYYKARGWLERAAALGHAGAEAKLGYMYTDGLTVPQDYGRAFEWFSRAAEGGSVDGLYNLGIFYLYGWNVEANPVLAASYFATASALGDAASEQALQQVLKQIEADRSGFDARSATSTTGNAEHSPRPVARGAGEIEAATTAQAAVTIDDARVVAPPLADVNPARGLVPEGALPGDPAGMPPAVSEAGILDEDWIRAQDPRHYTIQVIALGSRERLEGLLKGREALAPWAIHTVQKQTSPLHVLLQGSYADVDSARAARDRFPRAVQRTDLLWIRRFEKVQERLE